MNIGIVGGGSIGLLFAYYLASFHKITVYTRTKEQAAVIQTNGILLEKEKSQYHATVNAREFAEWDGKEEVAIVAVKQYHLPFVLEKLKQATQQPEAYLFLQNGMGHLSYLRRMDAGTIYIGSVEHGSYKTNKNSVKHTGQGLTKVSVFRGDTALLQRFISPLSHRFPFVLEADYQKMLIKKLVVNAVINPLTAILRAQNGELTANPYYFQIVKELFSEIKRILDLEHEEIYFQHLLAVCQKTAENQSSMLKDLEENRETEVEAILGYLLREADDNKVDAPLVRNLYYSIKGKEYGREGF